MNELGARRLPDGRYLRDVHPSTQFTTETMTICTALAWMLVLLLLPVVVLLWATQSRHTRIARYRRNGETWPQIAARYGVSKTTVRRWANA